MQNFIIINRFFLVYIIWRVRIYSIVGTRIGINRAEVSVSFTVRKLVSILSLLELVKICKKIYWLKIVRTIYL